MTDAPIPAMSVEVRRVFAGAARPSKTKPGAAAPSFSGAIIQNPIGRRKQRRARLTRGLSRFRMRCGVGRRSHRGMRRAISGKREPGATQGYRQKTPSVTAAARRSIRETCAVFRADDSTSDLLEHFGCICPNSVKT
ncbi:MAG: hypothetical protein LBI87_09335 [Candidatus Accumulibacter sp.]|jgi:hypothetical protein|nr:hypothetical protein [Accumulibacter sp.]